MTTKRKTRKGWRPPPRAVWKPRVGSITSSRVQGRRVNADMPIRNPDEKTGPETYVSRVLFKGEEAPLETHKHPSDKLRKRRRRRVVVNPR